jgi:CheY-like chemotaxis protein
MPNKMLKVLIVDDSRDIADSLAMLVQMEGHESFVAYDAAAGLGLAARVLPDLIIHDIGLPDMSGFDAVPQLRRIPALGETIFVAHTGYDTERHRRQAQDVGFDQFVAKPMNTEFLVTLLHSLS